MGLPSAILDPDVINPWDDYRDQIRSVPSPPGVPGFATGWIRGRVDEAFAELDRQGMIANSQVKHGMESVHDFIDLRQQEMQDVIDWIVDRHHEVLDAADKVADYLTTDEEEELRMQLRNLGYQGEQIGLMVHLLQSHTFSDRYGNELQQEFAIAFISQIDESWPEYAMDRLWERAYQIAVTNWMDSYDLTYDGYPQHPDVPRDSPYYCEECPDDGEVRYALSDASNEFEVHIEMTKIFIIDDQTTTTYVNEEGGMSKQPSDSARVEESNAGTGAPTDDGPRGGDDNGPTRGGPILGNGSGQNEKTDDEQPSGPSKYELNLMNLRDRIDREFRPAVHDTTIVTIGNSGLAPQNVRKAEDDSARGENAIEEFFEDWAADKVSQKAAAIIERILPFAGTALTVTQVATDMVEIYESSNLEQTQKSDPDARLVDSQTTADAVLEADKGKTVWEGQDGQYYSNDNPDYEPKSPTKRVFRKDRETGEVRQEPGNGKPDDRPVDMEETMAKKLVMEYLKDWVRDRIVEKASSDSEAD